MIGETISHYRVDRCLGEGGMGVVYRAEDLRLGRRVALKFLRDEADQDDAQLDRFQREARAASALNNPHICTVYDVGLHQGRPFIVMELLEGTTLADRLKEGPLPVAELLDLALQLAEALAAAHAHGIVHRDLKPQNIFLTDSGLLKVLDFGVAKLRREPTGQTMSVRGLQAALLESDSTGSTATGLILGTVPYMSPEQARGGQVDARSDLFSFGAVLYEMAAGCRAFAGETTAVLFDTILNRDPVPPSRINPRVPAEVDRIVLKTLEKDREIRYQTAKDLIADLKRLQRDTTSGSRKASDASDVVPSAPGILTLRTRRRRRLLLGGFLAGTLGLGVLGLRLAAPLPVPKVTDYVQITSDRVEKVIPWFKASPLTDGSRVYFNDIGDAGHSRISYVAATGGETVSISLPFTSQRLVVDLSRDGTNLLVAVFDAGGFVPGELWVVPAVGGTPRRLGDLRAHYAVWSPDGKQIALTQGRDLLFAHADGSDLRKAWTAPGFLHSPAWSPDGRRLRLSVQEDSLMRRLSLWEVAPDRGVPRPVLPRFALSACCGRWTPDGAFFVFEAGDRLGDLWVLPERGWLAGLFRSEPVQITAGAMQFLTPVPSPDARSLFAVGWKPQGELVRYDAASRNFVPYLGGMSAHELNFSRDGQWIVYTTYPEACVWRSRVDGRDRRQLTFPPIAAMVPRFSPDGTQVVFMALGPGPRVHLRLVPAAGGSSRALTPPSERDQMSGGWSPDGRRIAIGYSGGADQPNTIDIFDLATNQLSTLAGSEGLFYPDWSPDGRFFTAGSAEGNRLLVHDFGSGRWRVLLSSPTELGWGTWSRDSRFLSVDTGKTVNRVRIADGHSETIATFGDLPRVIYFGGHWVGATPDGSVLTLRSVSVNEIFALKWGVP